LAVESFEGVRASVWVSLLAILVTPTAAAGTEEDPEVLDPAGDVVYSAMDVTRSSTYLDSLALWIEYDAVNDMIVMYWKTADSRRLEQPVDDSGINCYARGNMTVEGTITGTLTFQWANTNTAGTLFGVMRFTREGDALPTEAGRNVPYTFEPTFAQPGLFKWRVERARLQNLGEDYGPLEVSCGEGKGVRTPGSFVTPLYRNDDDGIGSKVFSLAGLRPPGRNTEEPEFGIPSSPSEAADPEGKPGATPGPGVGTMLVVVLAVFLVTRGRGGGR
jgi:hypothetical protein